MEKMDTLNTNLDGQPQIEVDNNVTETAEQQVQPVVENAMEPVVVEEVVLVSEVISEPTPIEETVLTTPVIAHSAENGFECAKSEKTKSQVVDKLNLLAQKADPIIRSEVDSLKHLFYKIHHAETLEKKSAFLEVGGVEEDFVPSIDPIETEFKKAISDIRQKQNALTAQIEKQKEQAFKTKSEVLEELKKLIDNHEDVTKAYATFKTLQQRWNETKLVAQSGNTELWKSYQVYVEKFYDIIKINNEFRDYDFKKNLAIKTELCNSAEKLLTESDLISAFHQLQKLHEEWREVGPVSKEIREEIWGRFKNVSTEINRKHQQFFEGRKEDEDKNLEAKTALCERVEAIDCSTLKNFPAWDEKTKQVIAAQEEWKKLGFAPKKMNVKVFERFRAACDLFFNAKGDYFREAKASMSDNLEKKRELCAQAEALKESTDWKETSDQLIKLQKEWKTIGSVPRRYSDQIWQEFIASCDYFFEQKGKSTTSHRTVETDNLELKRQLIAKMEIFDETIPTAEATQLISEYIKDWNAIGHVPFKEKDAVYKQFHALIDKQFDRLNVDDTNRRLTDFKANVSAQVLRNDRPDRGGENPLLRDRKELVRRVETLKNEIKTYENNIGFFSVSSKKGTSMLTEMTRKIEKLKDERDLILDKIGVLDQAMTK